MVAISLASHISEIFNRLQNDTSLDLPLEGDDEGLAKQIHYETIPEIISYAFVVQRIPAPAYIPATHTCVKLEFDGLFERMIRRNVGRLQREKYEKVGMRVGRLIVVNLERVGIKKEVIELFLGLFWELAMTVVI